MVADRHRDRHAHDHGLGAHGGPRALNGHGGPS
jgi:hypothetical protein